MSDLPWLRLYTDMVDNEKIRLLAFEDRWHFIALLCCKQQGVLKDKDLLLERKLSVKLGLQVRELDEVKRRLVEVKLIDDQWEPIGWNDHQCKSDSSTERTRKYREQLRNKTLNVTVTSQERDGDAIDKDIDIDKEIEIEIDKKKAPKSARALLSQFGIDGNLADDFIAHRKSKKAPITETALRGIEREAKKAGITTQEAVTISIEKNWQGFNAGWDWKPQAGNRKRLSDESIRSLDFLDDVT